MVFDRLPGRDQLGAGRDHADRRGSGDGNGLAAGGCQYRDVHGRDHVSLHQQFDAFAVSRVGQEGKWEVYDHGAWPASFYAWATELTAEPTGENQYYTAVCLHRIYDLERAEDSDLFFVRLMAIAAYQAVLDHFPDSVSYDASGSWSFPLAPLAYEGIVALGGTPEGGWIVVQTPDGGTAVVRQ